MCMPDEHSLQIHELRAAYNKRALCLSYQRAKCKHTCLRILITTPLQDDSRRFFQLFSPRSFSVLASVHHLRNAIIRKLKNPTHYGPLNAEKICLSGSQNIFVIIFPLNFLTSSRGNFDLLGGRPRLNTSFPK